MAKIMPCSRAVRAKIGIIEIVKLRFTSRNRTAGIVELIAARQNRRFWRLTRRVYLLCSYQGCFFGGEAPKNVFNLKSPTFNRLISITEGEALWQK